MYYCKTRYYVPEWCRWLNADSVDYLDPETLNGLNLFAYCNNNPIMYTDPKGNLAFLTILIISVVVSLAMEAYEDIKEDGRLGGNKDILDYVGAFSSGVISSFGGGFVGTIFFGVVADSVDAWINGDMKENKFSLESSLVSNLIGFGVGVSIRAGASFIKAKTFTNMVGKKSNNLINNQLRPIANNLNIGANRATTWNITKEIFKSNKWKVGQVFETIFSSF